MKYKLINPIKYNTAIEQVLYNRGVQEKKFYHYLNTTDEDINPPTAFPVDKLQAAVKCLVQTIRGNGRCVVVVDADCDGYTSSAILINYLYDLFPAWVQNNLIWILHNGKQHGLEDCYEEVLSHKPSLVFCPDSSSNDDKYHSILHEQDISIIVLDHHEYDLEHSTSPAIIINSQYYYPNHELSGAGTTWQFCRYLDDITRHNFANEYLDLVALGLNKKLG